MGPKVLHVCSPYLVPRFTNLRTHPLFSNQTTPTQFLQLNKNPLSTLQIACIRRKETATGETLEAELNLQIKDVNHNMLQREEALKKSRALLFAEVGNFAGLQPEDLKKKWKRMSEEESWVLVNAFVSGWSAYFHPLSAKSVKQMVEEHVREEGGDLSDSVSGNLFSDFGKLLGFSRSSED